jgi:hypothetical protein
MFSLLLVSNLLTWGATVRYVDWRRDADDAQRSARRTMIDLARQDEESFR